MFPGRAKQTLELRLRSTEAPLSCLRLRPETIQADYGLGIGPVSFGT